MSKIEELIQQYCPNGVEYKKLGTLIDIYTGTQFNKSDMLTEGKYPCINGGIDPSGYSDKCNEPADTITISQGGASAGYVNWIWTDFWAGAHCYVVRPNSDEISNRYLYFFLKNAEVQIMSSKHGAGIPGLNSKEIKSLSIPLPPLPVQEEIVRILDNFTTLEAELEAELEARRKQYEYYRDKLLNFSKLNGGGQIVEWKKLGEVYEVKRGIRVVKKQLVDGGPYPVFQNSIPPMGYYNEYNRDGNMAYVICAGSSSGSVGYCESPFWAADDCFTINSQIHSNRYAYHVLRCYNHKLFSQVRNGSMPRLPHDAIDDLLIPIPSLAEQQRIVDILDRFDILVNDISQGLPAEIAARRKQYEYYRDKLLTFKEKTA